MSVPACGEVKDTQLARTTKGGLFMTQTTNYQLPQWEASDPLRREDFNGAMAGIEAGMTAAQQTADSAGAAAGAAYGPDNKPYVVGSYTGRNANLTITLGFRPSFLMIGGHGLGGSAGAHAKYIFVSAGSILTECVEFTDTGFLIKYLGSNQYSPSLVEDARLYNYIVFR